MTVLVHPIVAQHPGRIAQLELRTGRKVKIDRDGLPKLVNDDGVRMATARLTIADRLALLRAAAEAGPDDPGPDAA